MSKTNESVIDEVKNHVSAVGKDLHDHLNTIQGAIEKADKPTDRVLAWIEKSGVSVVIVGAYSVGMVALGSYLF